MKDKIKVLTFQEVKVRLERVEKAIEALRTQDKLETLKDKKYKKQLISLKESLEKKLNILTEMDKGVIHTDDENKAKDLAADGAKVILQKKGEKIEEVEGVVFDENQTKIIAKEVAKAAATALKEDGIEIASGKIIRLQEMSFDILFVYKDGKEDEFSFHIDQDKNIVLSDFTFSEIVGQVGLRGAGEPFVNKDVLKTNLLKVWAKLDGNMQEDSYDSTKIYGKEQEPEGDLMQQLENALKSHDWYYMMSDDHRWYTRGVEESRNIYNLLAKLKAAGKGDEAEALYKSYSDKNKISEASAGSIQKKHGELVAKMKALAIQYKGGDQSVVPQLKAMTAEKKKLEAELDAKVAGIGVDQELDTSVNEAEDFDKDGKLEKPEAEYKGVKDKAIKKAMGKKVPIKKEAIKAKKDFDKDGDVESPEAEYKGAKDKAVKKAMLKGEAATETYADLETIANDTANMPADRDAARNKMYDLKKKKAGAKLAEAPDYSLQDEVQELIEDMDLEEYENFAYDNDIDPDDANEMQNFITSLSDAEAQKILIQYGNKKFYIKVAIRDAKRALELINDNPAYSKAVEIDGSDTYYLTNPGLAYDLQMDFGTQDIEVIDSNVDMNEVKGDTELVQDPNTKEFTRRMKMTPKDMETIGKVQAMMAKEKSMKKEGEGDETAVDVTGKAYSIGDVIEFRGYKFQCQIGQRGIVVLQQVDDQLNPLPAFYEGGTPQFAAILKNAKIVSDNRGGIAEGGVNPEGDAMVLNFIKKLAKIWDIPMQHAVNFIHASIKRQGY